MMGPTRCSCGSGFWARRLPAVASSGECYVCGVPGERYRAGMARPYAFAHVADMSAAQKADIRQAVLVGLLEWHESPLMTA